MKPAILAAVLVLVASVAFVAAEEAPEGKYYAKIVVAAYVPQRLVDTFISTGLKQLGSDMKDYKGIPDKDGYVRCSVWVNTPAPTTITNAAAIASKLSAAIENIADLKGLMCSVMLTKERGRN